MDERESPDVSGSQWVAAVAPQLTIGRPGPLLTWGISGLRSFESYSSAPTPQAATDVASLWLTRTPTELSKLEVDGSYLRSANLFYLAPGTRARATPPAGQELLK